MIKDLFEKKEKKVEYIELIYDLIFVYIIGRNNSLLHNFSNGFVDPVAAAAYIMTTLAIIQIWSFTTYYINIYGRHGVREHVFMFINMFLLYFVGEGTRADWQDFHAQYHVAWALILVNIGIQYVIELRNHSNRPENRSQIIRMAVILFTEALIVGADIVLYQTTGTTWLSTAAIIFGMVAVLFSGQKRSESFVDFNHLSERVMLYVVFTFGEMIISVSSYFKGGFTLRSTYFALMAFLIVAGLFLSYGIFYDHIIDRDKRTNGLWYMLLHIGVIFAMNNITNGLEFMQDEEVSLLPKTIFLVSSLIMYFVFLFSIGLRHAGVKCRKYKKLCAVAVIAGAAFAAAMLLLREMMAANIAVTVAFVFFMFALIYRYAKNVSQIEYNSK